MKVHVIYAHPVDESFSAAIHRTVVETLIRSGHEVRDLDLYALGFDPAMPARERIDYHTPGLNEAPVLSQVEDLCWAEALVFLFPTWWYGMPAILKGYLDRVWLPGVAFHLPADGGRIQPSLTNIRADSSSVTNTTSAQRAGEVDATATTEADSGRPGCDRAAAQGRCAGDRARAWPVAQRD
jgi:putative NADPH-quinone reductase